MAAMTKIERVSTVLQGGIPDRAPVSFWYHFDGVSCGQPAVDAHLDHLQRYDLDFVKVMNDNPYPWELTDGTASALRNLPLRDGTEMGFGRQLDLLERLDKAFSGNVLFSTTIFNAWAVLRRLCTPSLAGRHGPPRLHQGPHEADRRLSELLAEDRSAVGSALEIIAQSLANFAKRCIEAGADGIFLSVRDDWVDTEANGLGTYEELVRAGDLQILAAAREGRFNLLHVCGVPRNLDAFAVYPTHVINWADRAAGPALGSVVGRVDPVVCGGVDNLDTLPKGKPAQVEAEVRDALRQAGRHPMIVSAGCTYDPHAVPVENLEAMVHAAKTTALPAM